MILDLEGAEAQALTQALELRPFEAAQLVRRGGFHLHRIATLAELRAEEVRLREEKLAVWVVPEAEARSTPLLATRGRYQDGELAVRHAGGELRLRREDVLMLVQGPIARDYQPSAELKRVRSASLEQGYRFHLHRLLDPRPLELDPGAFEFGTVAREVSSFLTLAAWVRELAEGSPPTTDSAAAAPALGTAALDSAGAVSAAAGLAHGGKRDKAAPQPLDNLAQFRFYSGWRSALERQRRRRLTAPESPVLPFGLGRRGARTAP